MADRPVIGITMGDPAGIGPEIILRAVASRQVRSACRPVVIGQQKVFTDRGRLVGSGTKLTPSPGRRGELPSRGTALVEAGRPVGPCLPGRLSARSGRAALAAVEEAVALALDGEIDGVVTAPISKEAIRRAGSPFPGHTEMLASLTGARRYAMMLCGGGLRVSLATIHIPLSSVPSALTRAGLRDVIELTWESLPGLGAEGGRIAVCGLNPHAGEGGIMGDEDRLVVLPEVKRAARRGIDIAGPFPADTVFHRALRGEFDAVVAMYHDQGLGPLKTVAFDSGVNLTLGLPIVRTSPDHGTAFDIAGRGVAGTGSLVAAVLAAASLARRRACSGP